MTPKYFLKSKNIPEPTYNGVRLVDKEMGAYKITDLLHEYALEVLKQANGAEQSESTCNLQSVINWVAVTDEIPPENKKVICWNGHRMVEQSWMQYTESDEEWFRRTFTYWTSDVKPPCL